MKNLNKIFALVVIGGLVAGVNACKEPFDANPATTSTPSGYTANFAFVNASPDAPSLDFFINNIKVGASLESESAQDTYTNVPITANGVFANTNIRAKATSGTIGGVLNKADLIYRSSNNGTGNFQASNKGNYTVIAVDTINRPAPLRTLDKLNFGSTTYYSTQPSFTGDDTTIMLSSNNSSVIYDLVKKHNGGVAPSFLIPIGVVPLGSTDVGGIRFLLLTDAIVAQSAGKFGVRFVNASPDAGPVTAKVNGVAVATNATYPMTQANFNPSVGSRSATVNFTKDFAAAGTYNIDVTGNLLSVSQDGVDFADGAVYTIVLSGNKSKGYSIQVVKNK